MFQQEYLKVWMILSMNYTEKQIRKYLKEKKPFECEKCGECCINAPCPLHPNDLTKIANFFGLSIELTIDKYLIWDYWLGENMDKFYYLAPKRRGDIRSITEFEWISKGAPCIFLKKENKKRISLSNP
ncbi:MAG: YkgJ family cysteine cluster protein [Promethearchaeota archaeon]